MKPLEKIFWDELGEMLHVEELLLKSLPKMKEASCAESLKKILDDYREEVQAEAKRVRDVFLLFELPPREKKCDSMIGLLTRTQQLMQRGGSGASLDAALLCQSRKIVSYKIAAYESLSAWAKSLQAREVGKMLEKSLKSEQDTASNLLLITPECNIEAGKQDEESTRKPVVRAPKRQKEFAESGRWGNW